MFTAAAVNLNMTVVQGRLAETFRLVARTSTNVGARTAYITSSQKPLHLKTEGSALFTYVHSAVETVAQYLGYISQ